MKEQVLIAIDTNQDPYCLLTRTRLQITKKLLKRFIIQKQRLVPNHQIGIVILTDTTFWTLPFTCDQQQLFHALDMIESRLDSTWNIDSLLYCIHDCLSVDSEEFLRILFIYGRSHCIPECDKVQMEQFYAKYQQCCIDIVYLHEKPSDENKVQEIFDTLGNLENGYSRSFEITRNYKRYLLAMTELLGNPTQRPREPKCHYWDFHQ